MTTCRKGARCGRVPACGQCALIAKNPRYDDTLRPARPVVLPPARKAARPAPVRLSLPCVHEGAVLEWCQSCGPNEGRHVRDCDLHDRCTRGYVGPAVQACERCPDYTPEPPLVPPLRLAPVGPAGLSARPDGYAFNAGLIRHRGRLLLAYRDGWAGSNVHVAELHDDYRVHRTTRLHLTHDRARGGREDPRLFVAGDELRVHFIGVERAGKRIRTSQLYARLNDDLTVRSVHYPELPGRQEPMEKNWSPFWHDGEHLAVYQTGPRHVIVRIDGDRAERIADTPVTLPWSGGVLRGGAPPVRVGDLYYHWFHGRIGSAKAPFYNVGLSVFEAKPPFRVVAMSPRPMLWGSPTDNAAHPHPCYAVVAFPCGAVLEGGTWKISMGWNDRGIRVGEWDAVAVDRAMGLT